MHMITRCIPAIAITWLAACSTTPPAPTSPNTSVTGDRVTPIAAQPSFASPEEALDALYAASAARDLPAMTRIVGLSCEDVGAGDPEQDSRQMEHFARAHGERHRIVADSDARARIFIGNDDYPLAAPLVRSGGRWSFDAVGGRTELIARVVGENELATIGVCRAFVQAQYEYYAEDRNGDDVLQYAQRLASTSGQRDGLYWQVSDGEPASPLGPMIAAAKAGGFISGNPRQLDEPRPYHGYLFKILDAQGENAPGGAYSYLVNGRMVAGFALMACPAKWNRSGVMTFVVGANGKVWQRNVGEQASASSIETATYNPDSTWSLVRD